MTPLTLTGLDGSNPLAFLAALGVLVALDDAHDGEDAPAMRWSFDGVWRPEVRSVHDDLPALASALDADRRVAAADPALAFTYTKGKKQIEDVKPPPDVLGDTLRSWADKAAPHRRRSLDWFTGFVSEGALDNNDAAKPSALHFTAGQQKFLKAAKQLGGDTSSADLRNALEGPWAYASKLPVMGWDNTEARDYALRASNPAKDKKLGNPGADWLALRGLCLLPTVAVRQRQRTPGVEGGWKTGSFAWPVWTPFLTCDEVRGLLVCDGLRELSAEIRQRRGIGRIFEVGIRRSDQGGYGSVTPAQPL